jgi:hypothetical protein
MFLKLGTVEVSKVSIPRIVAELLRSILLLISMLENEKHHLRVTSRVGCKSQDFEKLLITKNTRNIWARNHLDLIANCLLPNRLLLVSRLVIVPNAISDLSKHTTRRF